MRACPAPLGSPDPIESGRPFTVGRRARLSAAVRRDDWRDAIAAEPDGDPAVRARAAEAWTRTARAEHEIGRAHV